MNCTILVYDSVADAGLRMPALFALSLMLTESASLLWEKVGN